MTIHIDAKSIKGAIILGSVAIAIVGFIISTTTGAVKVTQTLERVNVNQQEIMKANTEQHGVFNGRITDIEKWQARKEGYDAARAEMAAKGDDGG